MARRYTAAAVSAFSFFSAALLTLCRAPAQNLPNGNLLLNSDFTRSAEHWRLEQVSPAAAELSFVGVTGSARIAGSAAKVDVKELGTEKWHAQFYQTGLSLQNGETYTLAFWARADKPRRISLNANVDIEDGHGVGLTVDAISLSAEWRKYAYAFTVSRAIPEHCRIAFLLGEERGPVSLAGTTLRKGKLTVATGPDLVRDGQFASPDGQWSLEVKEPARGAVRFLPRSSSPGVSSGVARFEVSARGDENWHVQAAQSGIDLDQGETYSLSFRARADSARPITIVASLDMPDWHRVAPDTSVMLGPTWKKHTVIFTTAHTVPKHSRIVFVLGEGTGVIEIADVTLRHEVLKESAAESPNSSPEPKRAHPLIGAWESSGRGSAGKLIFTFNSDGTGSIRNGSEVRAGQVPQARVSSAFRWFVEAPDSRAVVIGKEAYRWSVKREGGKERLTLTDNAGKTHSLSRR